MDGQLQDFLRALELNTRAREEETQALDRNTAAITRLAQEFEQLRANASPPRSVDAAGHIGEAAGEIAGEVAADLFRSLTGKRRKKT